MKNNSKELDIYVKEDDGYVRCIGTTTIENNVPFRFEGELYFGDIVVNSDIFAYAIPSKQNE